VVLSIVAPGIPFKIKIALTDENGLAVINFSGDISVSLPELSLEFTVSLTAGDPAILSIQDVQISAIGIFRFEAELDGKVFKSNPLFCSDKHDYNIYWGDPHIHTVLSQCNAKNCRSINFGFSASRHLSALDWASMADHVSNGRCELARWKEQVAASNAYNDSSEFVTIPAYEASLEGGCGGDNNVYLSKFPSIFIDECENGNTKTLCEKLLQKGEEENFEFFVVPHHTTRTGKHGEIGDEIYPGPEAMVNVEIHSKWGSSEYRGNPNPLKQIHPGPGYVSDLLNKGLRLGFVGGTDSHATMTFAKGIESGHIDRLPGLTAVLSDSLDRESIFQALKTRHCYAASGERILLQVAVNDVKMGQSLNWSKAGNSRRISIVCAGQSDIKSISIIRNGESIKCIDVDDWKTTLTYDDTDDLQEVSLKSKHLSKFVYYYVRVECTSNAMAWSSPVWIINP
jgi:hypothetical protein